MGKRYKGQRALKIERPDHAALFVLAGRKIVRSAGLLDAYRRGSGLLLVTIRTKEAEASLVHAVERARFRYQAIGGMREAWENSGRAAMSEYLAHWWQTEVRDTPPANLGPGDEFFYKATVAEITERWRDAIPDIVG